MNILVGLLCMGCKYKIIIEIWLIFFFLNLSNRKEDGNDVKNFGKKN